jgi:CRP/FNR family cyclic AMP-dependent transcriptional regulator
LESPDRRPGPRPAGSADCHVRLDSCACNVNSSHEQGCAWKGIAISESKHQLSDELLSQLVARGDLRTFARGDLLIREGDQSDSLYILVAGELKVFTCGERGRELVYNVLRPGEFFGEMFLDGGPRSASVKAVCTSICVVVAREEFRDFMREYPEFAESLVLTLISRVRHATEQLRDLALKDVYERAASLLNELAVAEGNVRTIRPAVTQQEIADRIGATREMVNHVIRDLVRGGFLVREGRQMILARDLPKRW